MERFTVAQSFWEKQKHLISPWGFDNQRMENCILEPKLMRAHAVSSEPGCPIFPAEGTGRKMAFPNHHPEAWTINLWCGVAGWNPLHPKRKKFSYCYGYCSFWFSTMPVDSRIEMKTGVWSSCHDAAAQKGKVPPTTWQDCNFFCPSILMQCPVTSERNSSWPIPLLKGWKSLISFFISNRFLWFLYLSGWLSGAVLMGWAPRFITEEVVSKIDGSCTPLSRWLVWLDCSALAESTLR